MKPPHPHPIALGVSACLTGEKVRYDGNDKRDDYIAGTLSRYFTLLPVCPEVAIGMEVPREPIELVGEARQPRARGVSNKALDVTDTLVLCGREAAQTMTAMSGYIFKSKSPSCGLDVRIREATGETFGAGLYAREIMQAMPLLPVVEERDLQDEETRDSFLERVFVYRRWQELEWSGMTSARLIAFHSVHKLILMAHHPEACRALGRLAASGGIPLAERSTKYGENLMATLKTPATRGHHANVMHHLMGYLKKELTTEEKTRLRDVIEHYRRGDAPLVTPLALLRLYFGRHPHPYVARQLYLYPPKEERRVRGL